MLLALIFMVILAGCAPVVGTPQTGAQVQVTEAAGGATEAINGATEGGPQVEATQPTEPQIVTRALTSEPGGLDPQGAAGAGQNAILPYLFDTLVYRDLDNSYKAYLAEKWEISEDGMQATFFLRKNIQFHDGSPLDAEAVKFTFDRLIAQGQKSVLASMVTVIETIEVVDAATVRFNFKEPSSTFMSSIANPYAGIVSPTAVQTLGEGFSMKPVGSGAFMLEKWEPGVSVTLAKNSNYAWAPVVVKNQTAPQIDRLVFKILPDVSQQISALEAGEVDVLFINQTSHVARLQKDPNVELIETTLNSLVYLGFNLKKAPFDDIRVRQALSHAINKEELVKTALGGIGTEAFSPLAPTLPGFDESVKSEALGYDPEKAKSLLKEAGFDGKPFKVTLLTSTRPPNQALATVLQSQMKAVGVQLEIQQLDSTAAQDAATKGDYDLMLWRYDWNDADVLRVYLSSERIGRTNRNFYSNAKVDELLEQAAHEMNEEVRNSLYLDAQKLILQDAPWQPLYTPKDYVAIRKDVTGVVMGPMGRMLMNDAVRSK